MAATATAATVAMARYEIGNGERLGAELELWRAVEITLAELKRFRKETSKKAES